jgi:dTDP-glucose 4,6-dehydratase
MKILITGGAGFIGSNFIRHLLKARPTTDIVNFDLLTYAGNLANLEDVASNPHYSFVKGDICDGPAILQAIRGCDAIVHFAAESHVDRSIYEPSQAIQTNVTGTFTLLQAAREAGIGRFIHISTDEVYGDLAPGEFAAEESPLRPSSPYSASKAGADVLVASFVRTYNFPALITRSSNNYGPFQFPEKFLPLLITQALDGNKLPIYGDGKQQRDWIHVSDNCRGILAVLECGEPGETYNIGGSNVQENLDLSQLILTMLDKPFALLEHVKDRPGHDRRYALDCRKIKSQLGWQPEISLLDGLRETIDWYKSNPKWLAGVRGGEYRSYYQKYYDQRDASISAISPRT